MSAASSLLNILPSVRGKLITNAPLADSTWFRVGGPAEVLFKPQDEDDLCHFLSHCPSHVPLTIMGVASNLLVRDKGIPGVVIRLGPAFSLIRTENDTITAGSAAIDLNVSRAAQTAGLAGMEFLSGIPGTIGGGLRMNAGAYGTEMKDIVMSVEAIDRNGHRHTLSNADMGFSYRHCNAPDDTFFISVKLKGLPDNPESISTRMQHIQKSRVTTQPIHEKTGGSTFANPDNDPEQRKSWQLIDAAGCRGLKFGDAKVSEQHCNFLINTGNATAAQIETLGEEVRKRVYDKFGVQLRWEIKRIGIPQDNKEI